MGGFVQKEKIVDTDAASEGDDKQDEAKPQNENNLSGGIHYTLLADTDNTKLAFQAHVDNTDQDFLGYVMHKRTLENGGKLDLTASGRVTLDREQLIAGALSTEVGYVSISAEDLNYKAVDARVEAKGALTFQAGSDISANVDGMIVYESLKEVSSSEKAERTLGGIVRGSFKKGKTEVYGVGCAYKNLSSDDTLITGAATFGIQINDLMKPGIAGFVEGTVCNTNANQNPDSSINGIKVGSRINF